MAAISELFDSTVLAVPVLKARSPDASAPLSGQDIAVLALAMPYGKGILRKLAFCFWLPLHLPRLVWAIVRVDAVHAPIPGDLGTVGMLLAWLLRKPLFVRHCGNWNEPRTVAEGFWRCFMERWAGGRNVMLATGGAETPPSSRNPHVRWIFATSLTESQLARAQPRRPLDNPQAAQLLIACRQEPNKGTDRVLEALPLLVQQFPMLRLHIVGDGSLLPKLREQAQRLGVADHVVFHGQVLQATVLNLMQQADLFCYPTSASEGFPKVVLEALACGLPVVTTRVSVLPQLLASGCGVLLEDTEGRTIAEGVRQSLDDNSRYVAMSQAAVATARDYSLEAWRDTIGTYLCEAWGPLRHDG